MRGLLPSINIMKGIYLLNPEGLKEFEVYQKAFENHFQCENIKVYILLYLVHICISSSNGSITLVLIVKFHQYRGMLDPALMLRACFCYSISLLFPSCRCGFLVQGPVFFGLLIKFVSFKKKLFCWKKKKITLLTKKENYSPKSFPSIIALSTDLFCLCAVVQGPVLLKKEKFCI